MRWGLVILGLCASATATLGRPRPPPPDGLRDPFDSQGPCDQRKSWPKLRACLERDHVQVRMLYEVEGAKLVALVTEGAASTPMRLYVQSGEPWHQASFYGVSNASSELLAFKRIDEHRYRIDVGILFLTGQRIWLRRQLTTLCTDAICRTIVTACDAFTDGKSSGTFHGTLYARGSSLFVVGDKSRAGPQCMPAAAVFRTEPVGDPLE
jgi:hypothetical protein